MATPKSNQKRTPGRKTASGSKTGSTTSNSRSLSSSPATNTTGKSNRKPTTKASHNKVAGNQTGTVSRSTPTASGNRTSSSTSPRHTSSSRYEDQRWDTGSQYYGDRFSNRYQTGNDDDRNYSRGGYARYADEEYRRENRSPYNDQFTDRQYRDPQGRYESAQFENRSGNREYQPFPGSRDERRPMSRFENRSANAGNREYRSMDDQRTRGDWSGQYRGYTRPQGQDDEGLRKLLLDQLKDMLWAEKTLTKAISKMIRKATSDDLIEALTDHQEVTEHHVDKVKRAFQLLGEKATTKTCEAMKGLVKEAEELMDEMEEGSLRDAAIICAAQKVEHYEIATYGSLSTYAQILGEMELVDLLESILRDEKQADKTLTQVALGINWEAVDPDDEEEEEADDEDYDDDEEDEEYDEEDEDDNDDDEEDEEEEEDDDVTGTVTPSTITPTRKREPEIDSIKS